MSAPVPVITESHDVAMTPVIVETLPTQPVIAEPTYEYQVNYEPEPVESVGLTRVEGADMAALMRELSSLNSFSDDEPSTQVITRPVTQAATPQRKKKSFFSK